MHCGYCETIFCDFLLLIYVEKFSHSCPAKFVKVTQISHLSHAVSELSAHVYNLPLCLSNYVHLIEVFEVETELVCATFQKPV